MGLGIENPKILHALKCDNMIQFVHEKIPPQGGSRSARETLKNRFVLETRSLQNGRNPRKRYLTYEDQFWVMAGHPY